jgi:hypothetical protein
MAPLATIGGGDWRRRSAAAAAARSGGGGRRLHRTESQNCARALPPRLLSLQVLDENGSVKHPKDVNLVYKYLLYQLPTLFCIVCCDNRPPPPLDLAPTIPHLTSHI